MLIFASFLDRFWDHFGSFRDLLLELWVVKKLSCHQESIRKLHRKDRFRRGPSPRKFLRLVQGGGDGEGKPPPLGVGGSEERKKQKGRKGNGKRKQGRKEGQ